MKTMKKSIALLLALVMVLAIAPISAFADEVGSGEVLLGDINGDGKVSAVDARIILRVSTKLEKIEDFANGLIIADADKNGKITAVDSRIVLRVSTKLESFENPTVVIEPSTDTPSEELAAIDGIEVNKLPYSTQGLTITSFAYDSEYDRFDVKVKNETGYAIGSFSNIAYKCYNSKGEMVDESLLFIANCNAGEICNLYSYATEDTVKIVFGMGEVQKGDTTANQKMTTIDGIEVNELPYSASGLTIISFAYDSDSDKVEVKIKNETGFAIESISKFEYKCYDAKGEIVEADTLYLYECNDGEVCVVIEYVPEKIVKMVFSECEVYEGEAYANQKMTTIDGIEVNELPYSSQGLTITSFAYNSEFGRFDVKIKNETGDAIGSLSNIAYKCYNSKGEVVDSSALFIEDDCDADEIRDIYSYVTEDTVKILFGKSECF